MDDHQPPKDELEKYRTRASSNGGGRGGTRRRTRIGSGGNDDECLFNEIMSALRKMERRSGSVPTLSMLANGTRIPVIKIRQVLAKFLPNVTTEGDTEFASSLRALLFDQWDLLVENGLISPGEWAQVQVERERTGEPISLILARIGLASENIVKNALELQYGVNYWPLDKLEPAPECLSLLPEALIRRHSLVPVAKDGNRVTILMVNPNDLVALDEIKLQLKGMQLKLCVCTEDDFQSFMDTVYSKHLKATAPSNISYKSNISLKLWELITDRDTMTIISGMIDKPCGVIIVTGPPDSGKTTTLYAALAARNTVDINIVTAEDPIKYDLPGITQVWVNQEPGVGYAEIAKAFLDQDADIMLIGEIRDNETANAAFESAVNGHLVFTTPNTNDAAGAVGSLEEMDVDPFVIASATIGIIAQRLVQRICSDCKEEFLPDCSMLQCMGLLDKDRDSMPEEQSQYYKIVVNDKGWPIFYRGIGCENCNGTGYRGRVGCFEVMRLNEDIRDLISSRSSTDAIRFAAKQAGMISLKEYCLRLVGQGMTTADEYIHLKTTA